MISTGRTNFRVWKLECGIFSIAERRAGNGEAGSAVCAGSPYPQLQLLDSALPSSGGHRRWGQPRTQSSRWEQLKVVAFLGEFWDASHLVGLQTDERIISKWMQKCNFCLSWRSISDPSNYFAARQGSCADWRASVQPQNHFKVWERRKTVYLADRVPVMKGLHPVYPAWG